MALFKISKGLKNNLPSSKTDGWCYFTTDDGKFWIDYKDTDNALKRKAVNAAYADTAGKLDTSAGDANTPVYFSGGKPVACTSLDLDTSGNAATATALKNSGTLDTQEKIDGFITANALKYATFKTTDSNNVNMVSNDGMIISIPWTSSSYGAQLAFDDAQAATMKVRGYSGGWGDWKTLLNSSNYTDYTVKKDGTGASGTWGIGISGNAATATALTTSAGSATQPVYFSNGKPTACTSLNLDTSGNAATATKLKTARTIGLGTGATGTATSFDGSGNITIPVTSVKEAYLDWGGKNFSGSYGPIDAAMVPALGANRLAFMPATGVEVQYSTNGGSTWSTYSTTNENKINLFNGNGAGYYIGSSSATGIDKSNYQLRIIITTNTAQVYTELNKFIIYCSTNGSSGSWCTIDGKTKANVDSGTDTWVTFANKVSISGWSGYNVINTSKITTYGNTSAQYQKLRFTFGVTSHPSSSSYGGLIISKIMGFGGVGWTTPSTMAAFGRMYTYDASQNVTFPAKVTATSFKGSLEGNATSASKVANALTIQGNGTTLTNGTFDGSAAKTVNITPSSIGAAASSHTHNYAGSSSAGGAANSVANSMTVQLNGGTTEGTNKFTFNGSAAKSVNITPSGIGAAAASHSHSQYELLTNKINQWTASNPSETAYPTEKLVKTALDGKANTGQKTTNSAGGHSHSLTVPVASITTEGTAASYTGHSFNAGSGSFTASVDANGVLSFSHTHTASTHNVGSFSANKPTKISITNTDYTTNSTGGHTHNITI